MSGHPGPDLDGDPEALEDPVHRGDATHQHDAHEHQRDVHADHRDVPEHQHEKQQGAGAAAADEPPADGD